MGDPAVSYRFHVQVDGHDIGMWSECSGLAAEYKVQEHEEGGQNDFVHKLRGRLSYPNITLKRPLDDGSRAVAAWFTSAPSHGVTASITVFNGNSDEVAGWQLIDVVPVKWTGPTFGATTNEAAQEQLELAHHGFM